MQVRRVFSRRFREVAAAQLGRFSDGMVTWLKARYSEGVQTPILVRLTVISVMLLITSYSLPETGLPISEWNDKYLKPIAIPVVFSTTLYQHWQMYDEKSLAWSESTWEIKQETSDGRVFDLGWPLLSKMNSGESFLNHKFRKYVETGSSQTYLGGRLPLRACRVFARKARRSGQVYVIRKIRFIEDPLTGAGRIQRQVIATCAAGGERAE